MEHQAVLSQYVATIAREMPQGGRTAMPVGLSLAAAAANPTLQQTVAAAVSSINKASGPANQHDKEQGASLLIAALPIKRSKRSNSIAESAAAAAASVSSVPNEVASGGGAARPAPALPQGAHMMALAVGMNLVPATSTPSAMGTAQGDKDAAPVDARAVQECVKKLKERVPWFDFTRVAPLEREHLARAGVVLGRDIEESVYVAARNALVRHSAEHPEANLTMTYARRLLRIDAAVAMRIHSLLNAHALINSRQRTAVKHAAESKTEGSAATAPEAGHQGDEEQQRLVTQLHQQVLAQQSHGTNSAVPPRKRPVWTDKEHEALLEALETDPTNWDRVQQAVGGAHSKEDCLAHFVQLPVEDAYLEDQLSLASAALQQAAAQHTTVAGVAEQQRHAEVRQRRVLDLVRVLAAYASTDSAQSAVRAARNVLLRHRQAQQKVDDEDERRQQELERGVLNEAEQTIERLEQRLTQLAEYERFVEDEWARLERVRKQLVCDRLASQSERT